MIRLDYAMLDKESVNDVLENNVGYLPVPLGNTEKGTLVQDLADLPHILICGSSGSGKTSFVQSLMTFLITNNDASKAKFLIFDSKNVDYSMFNDIPHLLIPIIGDSRKFMGAEQWIVTEIKRRFKLFSDKGVKDVRKFNENTSDIGTILPDIFIIIDDFSSLPQSTEAVSVLQEILKNGRTVGIHALLVTSITSSKVLQRDIVSNIPCRISFYVASRADSRVAIQQNGAELLSYPGEFYFRSQNGMVKGQSIYYSDDQIASAIKAARQKNMKNISALGSMAAGIFEKSSSTQKSNEQGIPTNQTNRRSLGDDLLPDAVDIVLETGQASASMLQRRLKLGYARAASIIDEMEELGYIGPFTGSKPRTILISKAQWAVSRSRNTATHTNEVVSQKKSSDSMSRTRPRIADDNPDIPMRSFPRFHAGTSTLSISDNKIRLEFKIITKHGPGTTTAEFNGKSVATLIYKKPRLFSNGYIQFKPKSQVGIDNRNPALLNVTKDNAVDYLRIDFGSAEAKTMKLFMGQISEDIGISVTEL